MIELSKMVLTKGSLATTFRRWKDHVVVDPTCDACIAGQEIQRMGPEITHTQNRLGYIYIYINTYIHR